MFRWFYGNFVVTKNVGPSVLVNFDFIGFNTKAIVRAVTFDFPRKVEFSERLDKIITTANMGIHHLYGKNRNFNEFCMKLTFKHYQIVVPVFLRQITSILMKK